MRLTLDFEENIVEIEENGTKNSIYADLKEKKEQILAAIGLEEIPISELKEEINQFFSELGVDIKCAE